MGRGGAIESNHLARVVVLKDTTNAVSLALVGSVLISRMTVQNNIMIVTAMYWGAQEGEKFFDIHDE